MTGTSRLDFLKFWMLAVAAVAATGLVCYANTFRVPFILDDVTSILGNPLVTSFSFTPKTRILGDLSFALNYGIHGFWLPGYHLVNILLHISNSLLLYLLATSLFKTPQLKNCIPDSASSLIALFAAVVFVAHPLHTQAVTYLAQRVTLLAAFFYLSSVTFYIRSRLQKSALAALFLLSLSIAAATAGVLSKENAFTLPLVILFCELTFFRGNLLKRSLPLLGYLLPMALLLFMVYVKGGSGQDLISSFQSISAETGAPSRLQYLLTQFPVTAEYLRLFFLPVGLNLDHDQPLRTSLSDPSVVIPFVILAALMITGVMMWRRGRGSRAGDSWLSLLGGFAIGWLFVTISVESSLIPIRDVMFEHRMYLPSAGIVILVSAYAWHLYSKIQGSSLKMFFLATLSLLVTALCLGTVSRNRIWQSEISIWEDVVRKSPSKGRGYGALGHAYQRGGKSAEAERSYLKAVQIAPSDYIALNNLGALYLKQRRYPEALEQLKTASSAAPVNSKIRYNLGVAYSGMARYKEAEAAYSEALRIRPDYREAAENLKLLRKFMARSQ